MDINKLFFAAANSINTPQSASGSNRTNNNREDDVLFDDSDAETYEEVIIQKNPSQNSAEKPKTYDESITMDNGEKTNYSLTINGKVYYYESAYELAIAKLNEDPSLNAVGEGHEADSWGQKTEFFKIIDNVVYYFESQFDLVRSKTLTPEAAKQLAVGGVKNNPENTEDITSDKDAVTMLDGEKTDYYIDSNGIRYYYKSRMEMSQAMTSNDFSRTSVGTSQIIPEWGKTTDYSIQLNGYIYYFNSEEDQKAAQEILNQAGAGMIGMPKFNNYVAGKREV